MLALRVVVAVMCSQSHVGVSEFNSTPALAPLSTALSGLVSNELQRMGAFKVTSATQVRDLLSLDRQKQLLGCSDETCGEATVDLGFDFLVTGSLSRYEGGKDKPLTLELVLLDSKSRTRAGSEVVSGKDEAALMANVSPAVAKLVGKLLKERSGSLVVLSSESAAVLKVDDVAVGTTPLGGKLQIAGGPHYLRLEKEGFVAWQKEIRIAPDAVTEESVRLVPSPDFIAAYQSKQTKLRVGAWVTTVLAVGSAAAAIGFEARSASLYGAREVEGTFLSVREQVAAGDETQRDRLNQLKTQVSDSQTITTVFIGVAAAATAGAVVLWLLGEDPGRYDAYREVGLKAAVGPGYIGLAGAF